MIGDLIRPVQRDTPVEVLRSVDLSEVPRSPTLRILAVHRENALGGLSITPDPLAPLRLVAFPERNPASGGDIDRQFGEDRKSTRLNLQSH